jgi:tetratricopeptide (TPR) repeat protein
VHRDIKPANLLVDGRGNLWIADFGLAHCQSQVGLTMSGDLVGTLRYMSPEQALAKRATVDHRTDIYSLGVTLYELLTLEPVFGGRDREELLRQIAFEEPRRPRQRNKCLPAELEIIVLKAIEKNPAERYATAQELADDMERFCKDEPIRARRPTLVQRARKWARRHQPVVWLGVAALSVIVVLLLGGVVGTTIGLLRALQAEKLADQRRLETAEAGKQALTALRSLTDDVVERQLGRQETLTEADRAFLKKIVAQYEALVALRGDTEESRTIRAEGYSRVGTLQERLGEWAEARASLEQARVLNQQLAADFPALPEYRNQLAANHNKLSAVLADLGKYAEAEAEFRQALELGKQLVAAFPTVPEYPSELANSHNNLGAMLTNLGKRPEAEVEFRQGLALRKQLVADFPAVPKLRHGLAASHTNLGVLLRDLGRRAEGEVECRQAVSLQKQLAADFPADPEYRQALANSHNNLGAMLTNLGKRPEAEVESRQGLAVSKQLVADFPAVPKLRRGLAASHTNLGVLLYSLGKLPEAEAEFRQALALDEQLAADFPSVALYREGRASSYYALGGVHEGLGQYDNAIADYSRAINLNAKTALPHNRLAWVLATCPEARLRDPARARAAATKAVELQPKDARFWQSLGWAEYQTGNWQAAIRALDKVKELGSPGDSLEWFPLAMAHWKLGHKDEARRWYDRAVEWMDKNNPRGPLLRRTRAEAAELLGIKEKKN